MSLVNRRTLFVTGLGFSSGLPLMLTGSTLQAWFASENISLITIGFLSLVAMPYLWKFLWSPIVDRFSPKFLGRRRSWVVVMQVCLSIALVLLAFMHPGRQASLMGFVAFMIAFFSATQDIAINAYQTELLKPEERGVGIAGYVLGYRVAMIISTGIALILASWWGFRVMYLIMALIMLANLVFGIFAPNSREMAPPVSIKDAVVKPFKEFLTRDKAILILLFIVLYKFGDNFATTLSTTFLLREMHFSLETIGSVGKIVGFSMTILGTFLGGYLLSKLGLYRSLLVFGFLQAFSSLFYFIMAISGKSLLLLVLTVVSENLTGGMGTAALFALVMSLCNKHYTATQFALFTALEAVARVIVGPVAAFLVLSIGWPGLYLWSFAMAFPGLLILLYLRGRHDFEVLAVPG